MMSDYWRDHLISPISGHKLHYDAGRQVLHTGDGREHYAVTNGLPILMHDQDAMVSSKAAVHQKLGTTFQYREHYERDAEIFDYFLAYEDGATRHEARRLHELIAGEVPADARHILDVGCGNAWVAQHFCPQGKEVISLDIAPRNPQRALEKYPFPNHLGLVADVYALPFPADTFDCIIAAEIIEHVADPALFLEKLMVVLRPGGKLIVTTPFEEKISYSLCVHCNQPTSQHAHLHSFSKDSLAQMLWKDQVAALRMNAFSNKALTKLQTHVLLQYLPTGLWRLVDGMANIVLRKPARLMMTVIRA